LAFGIQAGRGIHQCDVEPGVAQDAPSSVI